ncbi:MAG: glycosyltransferase [candidate division WOR-3 bacterium]
MDLVVAHCKRSFLEPTETFIGYQIKLLQGFKPIVLCHTKNYISPEFSFSVFPTTEILKGIDRVWAIYGYKFFRHLTESEKRVLFDIIRQHNTRLLHLHYAVDARYFLNLIMKANIPAVVSLYGYDISYFPRLFLGYGKFYLKPIFEQIDKFIAMSEDMKKDLIRLGCPEEKITVHYYGIEVDKFAFPGRKYEDKDVVNILMVGTLEVKKAQHLVLAALRDIEKHLKNKFTISIVGNGPMSRHLHKMVEEYGWSNKAKFFGFIPYERKELVDAYHNADIFALPSITVRGDKEGIPGTIVEAMASGLPVISSFHAGIPEVIENYKHGILVKEKDIEGLGEALKSLIESRDLRARLGRAAAERAKREFDAEKCVKNLEKIYQSLI